MDAKHFDHLTRTLSTAGSRRGLLHALASLPFLGWLAFVFGDEASAAKRRNSRKSRDKDRDKKRDKVGADNHQHEHRRRKHRNKRGNHHKDKPKQKKPCKPESAAQTCDGQCGTVQNNCQKNVDCGSCECDPACAVCQTCNAASVECEADPAQVGDACGACRTCSDSGGCEECAVCCDESCCADDEVCHAQDDTCCEPESPAETCNGECGTVENNCGLPLDCGPCECNPACPACRVCNPETGACEPDPEQEDQGCGDSQVCQANGTCACQGSSCGDCRTCGEAGSCEECGVCCDGECCEGQAVCHAQNDTCCVPESVAETCDGECGFVANNCGAQVDCGPCACPSTCSVCLICDAATGQCVPDPGQVGESCGDPWVCQADGSCICTSNDCGNCFVCGDAGEPCIPDPSIVCTPLDQCHDAGVCDPETELCTNPPKPDGMECGDGGTCAGGICEEFCTCGDPLCFLFQWGSQGNGDTEFEDPIDLAVAPDGTVYVVDRSLNRVTYFGPAGNYLGQWGGPGSGPGEFNTPFGIAVSPDGSQIYVVDSDNVRVQIFGPTGTPLGQFGSSANLSVPLRVAVSPDGNRVYVSDNFTPRHVQVFDPTGALVDRWGDAGTDPGQIFDVRGLAVSLDGNSVYVVEPGFGRVQYFSLSGFFQGVFGSGDGQFLGPAGIAVAPDGKVHVTSVFDRHVVQTFTANGTFIGTSGGPGSGNGEFNDPWGIAAAPDGTIYVADSNNQRVQAFCAAPD